MAWDGSICELPIKKQAEVVCSRFEVGDTKAGVKFSLAGTAKKGKFYTNVSEQAYRLIQSEHPECVKSDRVLEIAFGKKFCFEHVIPTEVAYRYLSALHSKGELTTEIVERVVGKLECAIITHEEDVVLSRAHLKKKMPDEWGFDKGSIFARYEAVGIVMHKWK